MWVWGGVGVCLLGVGFWALDLDLGCPTLDHMKTSLFNMENCFASLLWWVAPFLSLSLVVLVFFLWFGVLSGGPFRLELVACARQDGAWVGKNVCPQWGSNLGVLASLHTVFRWAVLADWGRTDLAAPWDSMSPCASFSTPTPHLAAREVN